MELESQRSPDFQKVSRGRNQAFLYLTHFGLLQHLSKFEFYDGCRGHFGNLCKKNEAPSDLKVEL